MKKKNNSKVVVGSVCIVSSADINGTLRIKSSTSGRAFSEAKRLVIERGYSNPSYELKLDYEVRSPKVKRYPSYEVANLENCPTLC